MLPVESINALQELTSTKAIAELVEKSLMARDAVIAIPNTHKLENLEKFLSYRRRERGVMSTANIDAFAKFVADNGNKDEGAVFIDAEQMAARAVLNYGAAYHRGARGHCDFAAELKLQPSGAYTAWTCITQAGTLTQRSLAEFMEDHTEWLECFNSSGMISNINAVATVRHIKIEAASKAASKVGNLSEEKSLLESVTAEQDNMPHMLYFRIAPYIGLPERTFVARLGVSTDNDRISMRLSPINVEIHEEQMAEDFAKLVTEKISASALPVYVGRFAAAAGA